MVLAVFSYAGYQTSISEARLTAVLSRAYVRQADACWHCPFHAWHGFERPFISLASRSLADVGNLFAVEAASLRGVERGLKSWAKVRGSDARTIAVVGFIIAGVLLATSYATIVLPWMQPDEPRHFEVAQHVARLGKPIVTGSDRVPAWEQEIIASMEQHSFWWYGFSIVGWDPANLPKSFSEIWGPAYSTAFFQAPLYYALSGGLMRLWGTGVPLDVAVMRLRLAGLVLFAMSLWGIQRTIAELFPERPRWGLYVLSLAALWPSHLAANAAMNNDVLAEVIVIWVLFFAVQVLRRGPTLANLSWMVSLAILGIGTKRSALTAVVVVPLVLVLWATMRLGQQKTRGRFLKFVGAAMVAVAVLAGMAVVALRAGRLGLPEGFIASLANGEYWRNLAAYPFLNQADAILRTLVGWFGWMRVPLPEPIYWVGYGFMALVAIGLVFTLVRWRRWTLAGWQKRAIVLFAVALVVQVVLIVGKQLLYADWAADSISQARYLYPVAQVLFLFGLVGLRAVVPRRVRPYAFPAGIALLFLFNIYVLAFVLYPFFWL